MAQRKLTDQEAAELAAMIAAAESADPDPTQRRGRPSLTGDLERSPMISFRLPPGLRERAAERAAAEGTTVSSLARQALLTYLEADR